MNSEQYDQAAKLRELALQENELSSPDRSEQESNTAVLDKEEIQDSAFKTRREVKTPSENPRPNKAALTKSAKSKKALRKKNKNEKRVDAKNAAPSLPVKQTPKPSTKQERITMDLPVYSEKDAVRAILPHDQLKETEQYDTETSKQSPDISKPSNGKKDAEPEPATPEMKPKPKFIPKSEPKQIEIHPPNVRFNFETTTQVIAVTGGKGGVGKSNIACNLGISFSRAGKKVLLMDADMSLANIDVLLGMTPKFNISHVISGEKEVNDIILPGPGGIQILPGGSGVEELAHLSTESMTRLFQSLAKLKPMPDIFLLDTAAGIHPNVLQFVMASDQVIVVTTPEPTAYVDAYALIKTLVHHEPDKEIGLLVNMAKDSREALHVIRLLLQLCRTALKTGFNNLGFIPKDDEVSRAVRNQQPFLLRSPNSPASKALRNIASTILQIEPNVEQGQGGITGFFKRLFKARQPDRKAAGS